MVVRVLPKKVEQALRRAVSEKVRAKYSWLLTYRIEVAREFGAEMTELVSTLAAPTDVEKSCLCCGAGN